MAVESKEEAEKAETRIKQSNCEDSLSSSDDDENTVKKLTSVGDSQVRVESNYDKVKVAEPRDAGLKDRYPPFLRQLSSAPKVQFADGDVIDKSKSNRHLDEAGAVGGDNGHHEPRRKRAKRKRKNRRRIRRIFGRRRRASDTLDHSDSSTSSTSSSSSSSSSTSSNLSLSSSSSSDDASSATTTTIETAETISFVAPDGGWGWVVVLASFLLNMIADGITFSFGVIFLELQAEFGKSKAVTSGVVSLFHSVPLLSGPVASALTDKYGCRKVTIFGSVLATIGFFLSALCKHIELLFLTFGLISGFGLSLCFVAAVVVVAYYFDRKRSFASGISACGSGVGTFVFAPLIQWLTDEYGDWRGATIILSAILLNICVCGMFFRELEYTKKYLRRKRSRKRLSTASSGMPEINEIRTLLGTGDDISHLFAQGEHPAQKDHPRHCSSLVHIPTFLMTGSTMPSQEVANSRRDGRAASPNSSVPTAKSVLEPGTAKIDVDPTDNGGSETGGSETDGTLGVPDAADDERPSDAKHSNGACPHPAIASHRSAPDKIMNGITLDNMEGESQENEYDKEKESSLTPIEVKLKRKVSSLFKKKPEKSILKKRPENDLAVMSHLLEKHPMNLRHLKVRRQSMTYRGAMLNINRYRLKASSCPDIYRNSLPNLAKLSEPESLMLRLRYALSACFPWRGIFNAPFLIFCLSNFILYAWYDVMYVYLVDYAEEDLEISSQDATFLISVIGILNTLGLVLIGYCGDHEWLRLDLLYAGCMVACGMSTGIVPFMTRYGQLATLAGIYGFGIAANYALTAPILVELVSLEQFSSAYGFLLLVQGLSNLVGPPIAGLLYDTTQTWAWPFGLGGACIVFSGLMLVVLPCLKKTKKRLAKSTAFSGTSSLFSQGPVTSSPVPEDKAASDPPICLPAISAV